MNRPLRLRIVVSAFAAALASCANPQAPAPSVNVGPSALYSPHLLYTTGYEVRWKAEAPCAQPAMQLVRSKTGKVVAEAQSMATAENMRPWELKPRRPSDLQGFNGHVQVFVSTTRRNVVVYENFHESSPEEQLIHFRKRGVGPTARWTAGRFQLPSRPSYPYTAAAEPLGIDDTFLYHRFRDGALQRTELDSLSTADVPPPR